MLLPPIIIRRLIPHIRSWHTRVEWLFNVRDEPFDSQNGRILHVYPAQRMPRSPPSSQFHTSRDHFLIFGMLCGVTSSHTLSSCVLAYRRNHQVLQHSQFTTRNAPLDYEPSTTNTAYSAVTLESDTCSQKLQGKRVFIKDMAYYWMPPNNESPRIAPSLNNYKPGVGTDTTELSPVTTRSDKDAPPFPYPTEGEPGNPTVLPKALLSKFHFTFLIRHPKHSIPSYQRCTTAPLDEVTGWNYVNANEAGYAELRRLFDYLRKEGLVGPRVAGQSTNGDSGKDSGIEICVLDADDVLDNPSGMIEAYCKSTGIKYEPAMLKWEEEFHQKYAREVFEKWRGWHDDAINSSELKARTHVSRPVRTACGRHGINTWTEESVQDRRAAIR